MKIISVNVGKPRVIARNGRIILSGIFKSPVEGAVKVRKLNLEGDRQADLNVHGGIHKAVYLYPSEHYEFWRSRYPDMRLEWGALGENLTTAGLNESSVCIGDRLRIGTAVLEVTQPRRPCIKLATKFRDDEIGPVFLASGRTGFYVSVIEEGELQTGDAIEWLRRHPAKLTITESLTLYSPGKADPATLQRALSIAALLPGLRRRVYDELHRKTQYPERTKQ